MWIAIVKGKVYLMLSRNKKWKTKHVDAKKVEPMNESESTIIIRWFDVHLYGATRWKGGDYLINGR